MTLPLESNYYQFGLTMARISNKAAGKLKNKFKYNGYKRISGKIRELTYRKYLTMLSNISINNQIDVFESELKSLDIMLSVKASNNVQNTFNQFELLLNKYPLNPLLLTRLLIFIQLIDDEQLSKEFSLNEIEY